jgi:hypothetical protein
VRGSASKGRALEVERTRASPLRSRRENEADPPRSDVNRFRLQFDPALLRDLATQYDYPGERALMRDVFWAKQMAGWST